MIVLAILFSHDFINNLIHRIKYSWNKNEKGIYSIDKKRKKRILLGSILFAVTLKTLYFFYGRLNEISMEIRIKLDDARPASVSIYSHLFTLIC